MEESPQRIDRDSGADDDQHDAECDGRGRLDPFVAVGVIGVRFGARELRCEQHQHVGDEVGQRMHAVGDQRLRLCSEPAADLAEREDEIDRGADEGDAADDGVSLGRGIAQLRDQHAPRACRFSRIRHRRRPIRHGW